MVLSGYTIFQIQTTMISSYKYFDTFTLIQFYDLSVFQDER